MARMKASSEKSGRLAVCLLVVLSAIGCRGSAIRGGAQPTDEQKPQGWSFFVLGDTRSFPAELSKTMRSVVSLDPGAKLLFNIGDLTANGAEPEWLAHHQAIAQGSSGRVRTDADGFGDFIRYVAIMGNHDDGSPGWHERWKKHLPGQGKLGTNTEAGIYYALPYQNVLFIALDSTHPSKDQTAWLKKILESPEAKKATWKLAFLHEPVYPCNRKSPFQQGLPWVQLFEDNGVDLAFVAHSHTFERTCPMKNGKCEAGGVVYLNTSAGAVDPRDIDREREGTVQFENRTDTFRCKEILKNARGKWRHFCHFKVEDNRLTGSCRAHDNPAAIQDEFTLQK